MTHWVQTASDKTVTLHLVDDERLKSKLESWGEFVSNQVKAHAFNATFGRHLPIMGSSGALERVLVGCGDPPDDERADFELFASLAGKLPEGDYQVDSDGLAEVPWEAFALGWAAGSYRFEKYVKPSRRAMPQLFLPPSVDRSRLQHLIRALFWGRDLINTPAGDLGPEDLVDRVQELAREFSADLRVLRGQELLEAGFPAIHQVGKGSERRPALIDLGWGHERHPAVCLVGKGVVFDSGGLNLKSASGMLMMKKDMAGGAVVLSLAMAVMSQQLPIRLRVLVPAVENSPGGGAFRPGDVINTRKGLNVEVTNTDAEGRLILCDALAHALERPLDLLVDVATLTGACRVALGAELPGFWTPCDSLAEELIRAAQRARDSLWRMPLWHPYKRLLKSRVADLTNASSSRFGGAITAAVFLHQFIKPFKPWVHLDVFGWNAENRPGRPKGGEVSALMALFSLLEDRYAPAERNG